MLQRARMSHVEREKFLRLARKCWNDFQQRKVVSFVVKVNLVVIISLLLLGVSLGLNAKGAHAESAVTQPQHTAHVANTSSTGSSNPFPYPACTWWADQRYRELHGVYVPWTTNANAYQWTARAYQYGWHVSSRPSAGAIINLQPWVQGAYGGGHVAVVEQVLSDGSVIASNMSWGYNPYSVVYWHFYQGSGVTFITQ
jgi:surface antigen